MTAVLQGKDPGRAAARHRALRARVDGHAPSGRPLAAHSPSHSAVAHPRSAGLSCRIQPATEEVRSRAAAPGAPSPSVRHRRPPCPHRPLSSPPPPSPPSHQPAAPVPRARRGPEPARYVVSLARDQKDVRAAQRLRHLVFAGEMGARLDGPEPGLDTDAFDAYCDHLLVREADDRRGRRHLPAAAAGARRASPDGSTPRPSSTCRRSPRSATTSSRSAAPASTPRTATAPSSPSSGPASPAT